MSVKMFTIELVDSWRLVWRVLLVLANTNAIANTFYLHILLRSFVGD